MLSPAQPTITVQPQSQTNAVGSALILSVEATGVPPLVYRWRKTGATVAGATNAALVFTNLQSSHAGNYTVVITNVEGAVTSAVALVRVLVPPAITTQPVDRSVSLGGLTHQVTASGTPPLTYQWHFNQTPLLSATNQTLILTNLTLAHAGHYAVVLANASGAVTSRVAKLEVDTTFTKITSGLIVTDAGSGRGCAWGDYNNDGFIDLYVANSAADGGGASAGADFLFHNNRDGTFTEKRAAARITE